MERGAAECCLILSSARGVRLEDIDYVAIPWAKPKQPQHSVLFCDKVEVAEIERTIEDIYQPSTLAIVGCRQWRMYRIT